MNQGYVSVPIEVDVFVALVRYLGGSEGRRDPIEVVQEAISDWIEHDSWSPE